MAYVYSHTRLDTNEIFYIGIGKDIKRAYSKRHRSTFWHNIINKTPYKVEILFSNLAWEDACVKETELIVFYGRRDLGTGILVNQTNGGEGAIGLIVSYKTKQKISLSHKGKTLSEETKRKMSLSGKGRIVSEETRVKIGAGHKGKVVSEETKERNRQAQKCRTQETKLKMNLAKTGIKKSEATKQKMSLSHKGNKYRLGTVVSKETRDKMSEARCKPIVCLNTMIKYESTKMAAKELNIGYSTISKVLTGKLKTTGGLTFKFCN